MAAKGRQVGEAGGVVPRLAAGPWEARTASYVAVDLVVDPSPGAVAAVPGAVVVADSRAAFPSSQAVLVVAATSLPPSRLSRPGSSNALGKSAVTGKLQLDHVARQSGMSAPAAWLHCKECHQAADLRSRMTHVPRKVACERSWPGRLHPSARAGAPGSIGQSIASAPGSGCDGSAWLMTRSLCACTLLSGLKWSG